MPAKAKTFSPVDVASGEEGRSTMGADDGTGKARQAGLAVARQDDGVGTNKPGGYGFAQRPGGDQVAIAETGRRIDDNERQVLGELEILKAVITSTRTCPLAHGLGKPGAFGTVARDDEPARRPPAAKARRRPNLRGYRVGRLDDVRGPGRRPP